jgi:hypothetical protein
MADVGSKFGLGGGGGPFLTDPKDFPRQNAVTTQLMIGVSASNAPGFWTSFDDAGDYVTGCSDNVKKTVVDVTGRGKLYGAIGPESDATGTCTWEITVDGVVHTLPPITVYTGWRSTLGWCLENANRYTTAGQEGAGNGTTWQLGAINDWAFPLLTSTVFHVRSPYFCPNPIKFNTDLKVELTQTDVTNALYDYNAGALWKMDDD